MGFRAGAQRIFGDPQVAPEPLSFGEAGNLGQLLANVQKQKAAVQEAKKTSELNNLKAIGSLIQNAHKVTPKLQPVLMKTIGQHLGVEGLVPDEDVLRAIVSDPKLSQKIAAKFNELNGATGPQADAISQELAVLMGSVTEGGKFIEAISKLREETDPSQDLGDVTKLVSAEGSIRQKFATRIKESASMIQDANKIFALSRQPDNPFAAGIAPTILAKVADPATGVREAEARRMESIAPGFWERVRGAVGKVKEGVALKPKAWSELLMAVRHVSTVAQKDIIAARGEFGQSVERLAPFGTSIEGVLGAPKLDEGFAGDISPSSIKALRRDTKKRRTRFASPDAAIRKFEASAGRQATEAEKAQIKAAVEASKRRR